MSACTVSYQLGVVIRKINMFKPSPVQCALKVVATREECLSAMAEWVMFHTAFWDTGDLSSAIFSVSALNVNLSPEI